MAVARSKVSRFSDIDEQRLAVFGQRNVTGFNRPCNFLHLGRVRLGGETCERAAAGVPGARRLVRGVAGSGNDMLLWIWLFLALVLAATGVGLLFGMARAERKARRALYRALDLDDATVDLLMARNGDVLADLALVRRTDPDGGAAEPAPEPPAVRAKPAIRLVHPNAEPAPEPPAGDPGRPAGDRRRLRLPGRS
jgi:hypothetical protein